jgi:hypothetical protein
LEVTAMIGIWIAYAALLIFASYLGLRASFGRHSQRAVLAGQSAGTRLESFFRLVAGLFVHRSSGR